VSIGQPHAPFAEFVRQTSNADEMRGQQLGRAVAMVFFVGHDGSFGSIASFWARRGTSALPPIATTSLRRIK
jgi:hypothetical protein